MPEAPLLPESPLQRQIAQMALELAAQLEAQVRNAPVGGIVDACEALLLDKGRQLLRDSLAATLQQQIDESEKKGARREPVPVVSPAATRGPARATSSPPSA
jgi:hypothetical protein